MRTLRSASVLAFAAAALAVSAQTINFNTVTNNTSFAAIPNGYSGYNWSNAFVEYGPTHGGTGAADPGSVGYQNGVRSGSYAGFNGSGTRASLASPTLAASIAGFSGYFTAAATASTPGSTVVTVQGLRGGVVVGTATGAISSAGPTLVSLAFSSPVDTLTFIGNVPTFGGQVVVDDLTISPVPEPSALAALGLGAAAMLRRRRRA